MQFRHSPQGPLPMSNEKRFAFFVVLMFAWLLGFPYILKFFGLAPPPQKKAPVAAAAAKEPGKAGVEADGAAKARAQLVEKAAPGGPPEKAAANGGNAPSTTTKAKAESRVALIESTDLLLGSTADKSPTGYRLE